MQIPRGRHLDGWRPDFVRASIVSVFYLGGLGMGFQTPFCTERDLPATSRSFWLTRWSLGSRMGSMQNSAKQSLAARASRSRKLRRAHFVLDRWQRRFCPYAPMAPRRSSAEAYREWRGVFSLSHFYFACVHYGLLAMEGSSRKKRLKRPLDSLRLPVNVLPGCPVYPEP